jgi:peptide chain release factor subunit 1
MQLDALIDRLVALPASTHPVVSLYLDGRPDQHGRETYGVFVKKELAARTGEWTERTAAAESFRRDTERILRWLEEQARPSANGLAIFACAGDGDLFEAVQLDAPIEQNELFVGPRPRVVPLMWIADQYRRYAAVVLDTHTARIFVFGLGRIEAEGEIDNVKTSRTEVGGWSQARFQRHVDNFALQHVKEVVDNLDAITRQEGIDRVVLAGDDVVMSLVREQLPKHLEEKLAAVVRLEVTASEKEVTERTQAAMREADAREDSERVARVLDAQRAGGLGAAGVEEVRAALTNGQVHELLISATPGAIGRAEGADAANLAEQLVAQARQTSALVHFIEDRSLLEPVGGVAARLRYRVGGIAA